jgi:octaprenyl-diphosphate synthase
MSEADLKRRILAEVQDELAAIEDALEANLTPHVGLVRAIAGHLLFAGGKRLRPLLMVLCARLCGYRGTYDIPFSTIFEYLHVATLLHDDVIDGGTVRRGRPAAHRIWNPPAVVLTGDFLLARALSIATRTGRVRILEVVAKVTEEMAQGEILQLQRKGKPDLTREEYLRIIRCKTAVLFEGACRVSAILADAPGEAEAALADYGHCTGLAFQMADDLLDYTEDGAALGKVPGADLREGKLTLPVIHALEQAPEADRRAMVEIITQDDFSAESFAALLNLLERNDGIGYTRRQAAAQVGKAKEALAFFPDSNVRGILMDIADYTLMRRS